MQILTKLRKSLALFGIIVFSVVVGVVTYKALQYRHSTAAIVSPVVEVTPEATPATKLPPTAIKIPKLGLNIPVQAALVHNNEWDIFENTAAWLSTSAVPGEGNVILYAHNRKKLFGDLYKLKAGDTVEVMQQNTWVVYTVTESRSVTDKDVQSVLSDENRLTLFTCEGSFDQKRRVVYALPV